MAHINNLTNLFKDFAVCLNQNGLNCDNYSLDTYAKARIILSRLYYACYHKSLEDFNSLRISTNGQKHKKLIQELKNSSLEKHKNMLPLIEKLQDLRIWADYDYTNNFYSSYRMSNLGYYIYQVEQQLSCEVV